MSKVKDLFFVVEELLGQGLDEVEIARKLDIPVDMAQELVQWVDEVAYEGDMETDPYS